MSDPGRPPRPRAGWLLVSWAVLLLSSLVFALLSGTGVAGLLALLPLFLLTAGLCLLIWCILRFWPRARFRALNSLRALLVSVLAAVTPPCL